jgi:hypothetical protein
LLEVLTRPARIQEDAYGTSEVLDNARADGGIIPPRAILAAPRTPRRSGSFCKDLLLWSLAGETL